MVGRCTCYPGGRDDGAECGQGGPCRYIKHCDNPDRCPAAPAAASGTGLSGSLLSRRRVGDTEQAYLSLRDRPI